MKFYEKAVLIHNRAKDYYIMVFDEKEVQKVMVGKHALWLPDMEIKIIWSHNGKIESFKDWDKGENRSKILDGTFNLWCQGFDEKSQESIIMEYEIMKLLAQEGLAPPVGDLIYIKLMVSEYPFGVEYCDVLGRFGYEVKDAARIRTGKFTQERMDRLIERENVEVSKGAYGDIFKLGNVVNGYLIDVRRTLCDMIKFRNYDSVIDLNDVDNPSLDELQNKIVELTQFPHKERKQNYQSYFVNGGYSDGSRDTEIRYQLMGIKQSSMKGCSVLDLGCNLGAMLFEAFRRGATKMVGLDKEKDYINTARELAFYNKTPINFIVRDLSETDKVVEFVNVYFRGCVDVVFALSLYKHIGNVLFDFLKKISWKTCYIESNNASEGLETGHVKEILKGMKSLEAKVEYLGQTTDRSPRCVWRLEAI